MDGRPSNVERWRRAVRRIVGLIVLALVVFWVLSQPDSAAGTIQNIGATLRGAAESVIRFFTQLV